MIPVRAFAGRRVIVLGLTRSGIAAARAVAAGGAQAAGWDADDARRAAGAAAGVVIDDPTARDWADVAAVIVGDPALLDEADRSRALDLAEALDVAVLTEFDLLAAALAEAPDARLVGVIGGSDAAPAAALVAAMMSEAGLDASLAGAAAPALSLKAPRPGTHYVAPLAPEQLRSAHALRPDAVVVLDGAARDSRVQALAKACPGPIVVDVSGSEGQRLCTLLSTEPARSVIPVSARQTLAEGVSVLGGALYERGLQGGATDVVRRPRDGRGVSDSALAAAWAVARRLGAPLADVARVLAAYRPPRHYGASVGALGGLTFVDCAAAQTPDAAVAALDTGRPSVWLAGPSLDRSAGDLLVQAEIAPDAVFLLNDRKGAARRLTALAPCRVARSLDEAVVRAAHAALRCGEDVDVIYAPGCAGDGPDGAADRSDAFTAAVARFLEDLGQGAAA